MPEHGFSLARIFPCKDTLYGKIRNKEHPFCGIFYAVNDYVKSSIKSHHSTFSWAFFVNLEKSGVAKIVVIPSRKLINFFSCDRLTWRNLIYELVEKLVASINTSP